MRRLADGLSFPTSVAHDGDGTAYVAESGLAFGGARPGGRVLRLDAGGPTVLCDGLRAPVNGLTYHDDGFYVAEGGDPGRISRLSLDGERTTVLDGLPGGGNYHTNTVAVGPDGRLYFGQGAMTNTGIVGLDAFDLGWLGRLHPCDVPGLDLVLAGVGVETADPATEAGRAVTGAFSAFGVPTEPGERRPAGLPCTAAILSCEPDGGDLRLVAWGVRNAYGLGFLPDGRLLATDQGADDRGSRPVGHAPDLLVEIREGAWYGWPDFVGGRPITDPAFAPQRGPAPTFLLANHDALPPPEAPLLAFPVNAAATKFDVVPAGPHAGQILVTLFGDEKPMTAPPGARVGRSVARVDPADWSLHPIAPGPWARPIDVRCAPDGASCVVLDFGAFEMTAHGVDAAAGSGALWHVPLA